MSNSSSSLNANVKDIQDRLVVVTQVAVALGTILGLLLCFLLAAACSTPIYDEDDSDLLTAEAIEVQVAVEVRNGE